MYENLFLNFISSVIPYTVGFAGPILLAFLVVWLVSQITRRFGEWIDTALSGLGNLWASCCRPVLNVIFRCIVPIIGLSIVALALLCSSQGSDMLQAFAEDAYVLRFVGFLIVIAIWSAINAIWGNLMLHVVATQSVTRGGGSPFKSGGYLDRYSVRVLAAAPFLVMGIAAWVSSKPDSIWFVSLAGYCVAGVLFAAFVTRSRVQWVLRKLRASTFSSGAQSVPQKQPSAGSVPSTPFLPFFLTVLSLIAFAFVAICATIDPIKVGSFFGGPVTLLCFAATTWVAAGCGVHWCAYRYSLPLLRLLLVAALVSSSLNDYYPVRPLAETAEASKPLPANRIEFSKALNEWMKQAEPTGGIHPFIIVATAGGALRATHWTATVLENLGQDITTFPHDLFAISGVSGGAVGASLYRAWLYEQQSGIFEAPCKSQSPPSRLVQRLWGDYLSPLGAAMLYPDFAKTFLLFKVDITMNRATAIEQAIERHWHYSPCVGNPVKSAFTTLGGSTIAPPPYLFLNATAVQSGRRIVASPIFVNDNTFPNAVDMLEVIGGDISLSTAANASARFPFFGPAASLYFACRRLGQPLLPERDRIRLEGQCRDSGSENVLWDRVVDGGHFENFGVTTAADILREVTIWASSLKDSKNIVPIVIVISSDPDLVFESVKQEITTPGDAPLWFAPELTAQPYALAMSRESRGARAVHDLTAAINHPEAFFYHFRLDEERNAKLNWVLSDVAQGEIRDSWMRPTNKTELARLTALYTCFEKGYRAIDKHLECTDPVGQSLPPIPLGAAVAKCKAQHDGQGKLINLSGCRKLDKSIFFSSGSPDLNTDPDGQDDYATHNQNLEAIETIAQYLCVNGECAASQKDRTPKSRMVAVVGFADSQDKENYNIGLSLQRAQTVTRALQAKMKDLSMLPPEMCSIALGEIEAVSYKSHYDRRVDIYICQDSELDIMTAAGSNGGPPDE